MLLMEIETPTSELPDGKPPKAGIGAELGHEDEAPVFVRREVRKIVIRKKDPCDPEPPRIPFYEGDELIQMEAISHTSVNTTSEVDDTHGLVFDLRLVPTGREPDRVYAPTLRHGEEDDGRRVHVEPGESLIIEQLTVALDHLDAMEEPTESGYVPLTPVLWSWFAIGERNGAQFRHLLAEARRLDQANEFLMAVERRRAAANEAGKFGPAVRRHDRRNRKHGCGSRQGH